MNVLILGGDGFIGSHLARHYIDTQSANVTIVDIANLRTTRDSNEYKYICRDLSHSPDKLCTIIEQVKPDLVFNCVAVANPSYYVSHPIDTFNLDFKVNYENICIPLIESRIPFVQFSTSEVYGKKWTSPYVEDTSNLILGPTHKTRWIYATSKILLEQLILADSNADCCIIRPQNFIGWDIDWLPAMPGNKDKTWIPRLPACFLSNLSRNKRLTVVLPGTQQRCYTHIADGISGIIALTNNWDKASQQVFNIGNPHNEITITDMAQLYRQIWTDLTGKSTREPVYVTGEKFYGQGYEDCERRMFSYDKIHEYTGWDPIYNIIDTVTHTIADGIVGYKLCE